MQQTFVKHVAILYRADFVSSPRGSALDRLSNVAIILTEKKISCNVQLGGRYARPRWYY